MRVPILIPRSPSLILLWSNTTPTNGPSSKKKAWADSPASYPFWTSLLPLLPPLRPFPLHHCPLLNTKPRNAPAQSLRPRPRHCISPRTSHPTLKAIYPPTKRTRLIVSMEGTRCVGGPGWGRRRMGEGRLGGWLGVCGMSGVGSVCGYVVACLDCLDV